MKSWERLAVTGDTGGRKRNAASVATLPTPAPSPVRRRKSSLSRGCEHGLFRQGIHHKNMHSAEPYGPYDQWCNVLMTMIDNILFLWIREWTSFMKQTSWRANLIGNGCHKRLSTPKQHATHTRTHIHTKQTRMQATNTYILMTRPSTQTRDDMDAWRKVAQMSNTNM